MVRAKDAPPPSLALPKVVFEKVEDEISMRSMGTHDLTSRAFGYGDFTPFSPPEHHYIRHIEPLESELACQVEYDMDEQDREWLNIVNAERKKDDCNKVSYEAFEIIMDVIEKEWFRLTKNITKPDFAMPSEDSTCAICDDSEGENSNAIVFCDGCNLAVHQDCYGVPYIPEGQWLCRKCTVSPEVPVFCILCPNEGGAFKQTAQGDWVHLLCAIWVPETRVANDTFMEPIIGVERISKQRWKLRCSVCDIREGACIQCAKNTCFLAFHATCARREKLLLPMKTTQGAEPMALTSYCDRHLPKEQQDIRNATLIDEDIFDGNRKSKSARAYAKTYKTGPPLVPAIIVGRVEHYIERLKVRKRTEFVQQVCRYWSLKREARRGAPLLKRLHLEPWTANGTGRLQSDEDKQIKLELLKRVRSDLLKVHELTQLMRKRETKKLRQVEITQRLLAEAFFAHEPPLRHTFEKISAMDRNGYFKHPVSKVEVPDYFDIVKNPMSWSVIDEKLDAHKYWDVEAFVSDITLVLSNAILYNKSDTPFYRLAHKIKAQAQPLLDKLSTYSVAHAATVEGSVSQLGDFEPPLSIVQLLTSTEDMQNDPGLLLDLDTDPLNSLFSYEFGKLKETSLPKSSAARPPPPEGTEDGEDEGNDINIDEPPQPGPSKSKKSGKKKGSRKGRDYKAEKESARANAAARELVLRQQALEQQGHSESPEESEQPQTEPSQEHGVVLSKRAMRASGRIARFSLEPVPPPVVVSPSKAQASATDRKAETGRQGRVIMQGSASQEPDDAGARVVKPVAKVRDRKAEAERRQARLAAEATARQQAKLAMAQQQAKAEESAVEMDLHLDADGSGQDDGVRHPSSLPPPISTSSVGLADLADVAVAILTAGQASAEYSAPQASSSAMSVDPLSPSLVTQEPAPGSSSPLPGPSIQSEDIPEASTSQLPHGARRTSTASEQELIPAVLPNIDKRDSFTFFETGWILQEGQKRNRGGRSSLAEPPATDRPIAPLPRGRGRPKGSKNKIPGDARSTARTGKGKEPATSLGTTEHETPDEAGSEVSYQAPTTARTVTAKLQRGNVDFYGNTSSEVVVDADEVPEGVVLHPGDRVVRSGNVTIIEELDTPATRREKSMKRKGREVVVEKHEPEPLEHQCMVPLNAEGVIDGGTLVWAKANMFPWWPGVIFERDDEGVLPRAKADAIRLEKKAKETYYIVNFFDDKSEWSAVPHRSLRLLGESDQLDADMIAPRSSSKMQRWKDVTLRESCRQAFHRALAEMDRDDGSGDIEVDETEVPGVPESGQAVGENIDIDASGEEAVT